MGKYSGFGNEVLAPLAYGGDAGAVEELELRGNTVITERRVLQKTVDGGTLYGNKGTRTGDVVVIENGRIVKINDVDVP